MPHRREPIRTCMGCRTERPKRELIRVVKTPSGETLVDPTGKRSGRGAYICPSVECFNAAVKRRSLERALGTAIPEPVKEQLKAVVQELLRGPDRNVPEGDLLPEKAK
ncbi:MAG: RNase P modulator RnpM [Armatimonadota bacterium]